MGLESGEETIVPKPRAGEKFPQAWKSHYIIVISQSQAWKSGIHLPPFALQEVFPLWFLTALSAVIAAAAALKDWGPWVNSH